MYDVITVGSATVDGFINTGSKLFQKSAFKKYVKVPFGSKIVIDELKFDVGGGGTNTAVSLSRLGLKVAYLGAVGHGSNSRRVIGLLKKENINTDLIQQYGGRTGYSVILDAKGHDRTILTFKGSNNELDFEKIKKSKLKTKWFYFSSMLKKSLITQKKIAEFAKSNDIKIAYNPSSYLVKKSPKEMKEILKITALLVLNKEEAEYLVGKKHTKKTLQKLLKLGPQVVIVTDGKNPTYASEGKYLYTLHPRKGIKVLEATGAGDAFASSCLAGIIKKGDLEFALLLGMVNSESVITHYGAKNKLLSYKEALNNMKGRVVFKEIL